MEYVTARNAAVAIATVVLVYAAATAPPLSWLPKAGETQSFFGTFLAAQASITALTLAVTLFVIQGARIRQDSDQRVFNEYIKQSRVGIVFWVSLISVGITAATFLAESFFGDVSPPTFAPGMRNLSLVAAIAFFVNLLFVAVLFRYAIWLARPEHWQDLRQFLNKHDVQEAVGVFLERHSRAVTAMDTGELDSSVAFPAPGEGSANEAIERLIDDAKRAMAERRLEVAKRALNSIRELIKYALDELSGAGFRWSAPGSRPQWPPLRELGSNLYSFREEVIDQRNMDIVDELSVLDYWCMDEGMRRSCGELFTFGLSGNQHNYEIASRLGNGQLKKRFGEQFWEHNHRLVSDAVSQENPLYIRQIAFHFEHLLNDAMQSGSPADYKQLHESFERCIRATRRLMSLSSKYQATAEQVSQLEQDYRIALMGLGGRAALLAGSGAIVDPNPYLDVVREKHDRAEILADDIAQALKGDSMSGHALWRYWETEDVESFQSVPLRLEKYPLTWFAIRLVELSTEPLELLNLHGQAQRSLNWFETNSGGLETYIRRTPHINIAEMRQNAIDALHDAVNADEVSEDLAIIGSDLSQERTSDFQAKAQTSAFETNSIKRLFERVNAVIRLRSDADQIPDERFRRDWPPKAFLADLPKDSLTYYSPLEGDQFGRALSEDVTRLFCEALENAPQMTAALGTPEELLQAIDAAAADLNTSGGLVVVLVGDLTGVGFGLDGKQLDGYEPMWQTPEEDRVGEIGRYRGNPIIRLSDSNGPHLYVVEVDMWGWFVDATLDPDYDFIIEFNPVTAQRAQEYLVAEPQLFSEQPDERAQLRKLQTLIEIAGSFRTEFLVIDSERARSISDIDEAGQQP